MNKLMSISPNENKEKEEINIEETKERQQIKISVRNLIEFILRSGDIDNTVGGKSDKDAMQAGSKLHRKIQKSMPPEYMAEVMLKQVIPKGEFDIIVEGRADGIIKREVNLKEGQCPVTIDEIKCMYMDLEKLSGPIEIHEAQAKCYGFIYSLQNELPEIEIQMTYCNIDTEEKRYFKTVYTFEELSNWFQEIINAYYKWAKFQYDWSILRNQSIKNVEFPFEYREGQRELTANVYRAISRKTRLFIQASTGVGKTISTVFPAIKAIGESKGDKIFYLTAKTITRTVASEAFEILRKQELRLKTIIITAKEKSCLCEKMDCNPGNCPYAKGHYDRVNDAVFDLINNEDCFDREKIEEYAIKHNVCPFEMSLDVSTWSDAIICDYNYVFDPNVALKRFFAEGNKGEYLFLIDEAHNLVERGREMYSASLYKEDFLIIKNKVKYENMKLAKALERCNRNLLVLKRECENYEILENIAAFAMTLLTLSVEIEKFLESCNDRELRKEVLDFYFEIRHFINMYENMDDNYVTYTEHDNEGRFRIKLFCVNPSKCLCECIEKGNSAVFFSATLLPINYYKALLSGDTSDYAIYAESIFKDENRKVLIGTDVSSKYTRRNVETYEKIAEYIYETIKVKKGKYMVFFPSYRFMQDVYSLLNQDGKVKYICQHQGMKEIDKEEFLNEFSDSSNEEVVGLCVLGGVFSEGIDLKGDDLIGSIIVGTGLPQICNEREILKNYYDLQGDNGFDFAYRFPGINKVLQAAGRVIRTEEDKGIILLLDDRFGNYQYKQLFPREWKNIEMTNRNRVLGSLRDFWKNED